MLPVWSIPSSLTALFYPMNFRSTCVALAAALVASTACKRQEITVYVAPKDGVAPAAKEGAAPAPKISYTLPEGWKETGAGKMSTATFALPSDAGEASVSITPLPNLAGKESMIVNMWREQAGATPLDAAQTEAALTPVEVAGETGKLFEITGAGGGKSTSIVTALLNRPGNTWFFKLAGDQAAVAAQKPAFLNFIKSVRLPAEAIPVAKPDSTASAPSPASTQPAQNEPAAAAPNLAAPEGWRTLTPGQMQVAKFAVPEQGEAKAEVAVSMFSSDTGGALANINRWRRQLGLADVDEAGLDKIAKPLDATLPGAVVADLENENRRMIGAIVPRDSGWWFYKLTGDAAAVAAAREAFLQFAKSQPKS